MKRLLVSLICICVFVGVASAQKIYLVCVGVADYPGTKYDLRLPVKDAETIRWVYQKNKRAETVLLTNSQATRKNVLNTMKKSFSKASANDIIVLFFSGHGDGKGFVADATEYGLFFAQFEDKNGNTGSFELQLPKDSRK